MDLALNLVVPSMSCHPKTRHRYPAINKPVGVLHWLRNSPKANVVEWVVILDADIITRKSIVPWKLGVEKGKQVHTKHPSKADHHDDDIVYRCNKLLPMPPYPQQILAHRSHGCPAPPNSKHTRFLQVCRQELERVAKVDNTVLDRNANIEGVNENSHLILHKMLNLFWLADCGADTQFSSKWSTRFHHKVAELYR
ncbi:hypothetical protein L7F22_006591 [Adiantum nelumboides]|nr:hypothetical protein [Adiantum nelumboides]